MVTLFFFGRSIEAYFGPKRLLFSYLLGALFGGGFSAYRDTKLPYERYTLGASGAVNAVLTYFIFNFPKGIWFKLLNINRGYLSILLASSILDTRCFAISSKLFYDKVE